MPTAHSDTRSREQKKATIATVFDFIQRTMMHHAMWYAEIQQQLGRDTANQILSRVTTQSLAVQLKRLSRILGFELDGSVPLPLLNLPQDTLDALQTGLAANWLANDGIWFQALESDRDMACAKRCNDATWAQFSPFEAAAVKRMLNLGDQPGLAGLKQALEHRLYAAINEQSITDETPTRFVFQMNNCRVQAARNRKGLADYPCKSAGIIEYTTFATAIDSRIKTTCLNCPPDAHPSEYYCAWAFEMVE